MLPFNFVFCGLVSIFLVYSLNSKSEGVLVTDNFSSIPYYCYYLMKKIKSDWSMCQGSHVNSQSQDTIMADLIFQRPSRFGGMAWERCEGLWMTKEWFQNITE